MKNKKIIAMIPARLGSKRVKNKNLREINGKALVAYPIEAAIKSGIFDEIYLNSEADEFKEIAKKYGIKFYKRKSELAQDDATNDAFAADFIDNVKCDILVQLLPTSPFISDEIIKDFIKNMENVETLVSVKNVKIECFYKNSPINFDPLGITLPSQMLEPVQAYSCGIMGWNTARYKENMKIHGAAYHGGSGKIGTYVLKGFSTVDIDEEEDFQLAEIVAKTINPKSICREGEHVEADVPSILAKDGVKINDLHDANKLIVNVKDVITKMGNTSWSKRLVNTESNSACLICQNPGEGNRRHYHADWNEWWYIVQGEWIFEIDYKLYAVKTGDLVFIAKGKIHRIEASGSGPAIRLAVSREDVGHVYVPDDISLLSRRMMK